MNIIKAKEVRVIDENGQQLGVMIEEEAIKLAKSKGLDLIKVTEKVNPPICKIGDLGKFLYHQQKKERKVKHKNSEVKGIRLTFGISEHDLEIRAKQAEKFLKEGNVIRVEMRLRGREKALSNFSRDKIKKFVEILQKLIPLKIEKDIRKEPRGLSMIISKE